MIRVCWFGAYDPDYPRQRVFRQGLACAGVEVIETRVPERRAVFRYPALLAEFARTARAADVILVPAFRHKDVPIASWLRAGRPLVFDPLVSRHDTLVGDWGLHAEHSMQARWNGWIDRWSLSAPDLVLCDTWEHGRLFERLGAERARLRRVLVGAEQAFFDVPEPSGEAPVRVRYVGGFLPLHGVPVLIEAAARLEREATGLPEYTIELVGDGIEHRHARDLAERAGLQRVSFLGKRSYSEAPAVFGAADIVLGAFGASDKAGRVIPHKVFQGLATGRAVLTGDGEGIREVFEPGRHLLTARRGDPEALAHALRQLITDPERRRAIGAAGRARAREVGTPERIGAELKLAFESVLAGRR